MDDLFDILNPGDTGQDSDTVIMPNGNTSEIFYPGTTVNTAQDNSLLTSLMTSMGGSASGVGSAASGLGTFFSKLFTTSTPTYPTGTQALANPGGISPALLMIGAGLVLFIALKK